MKHFTELYHTLERPLESSAKVKALIDHFNNIEDKDKIWTLALLINRKPKRLVPLKELRKWAESIADIPKWLLEESFEAVGDITETISAVLPTTRSSTKSINDWISIILEHKGATSNQLQLFIFESWSSLQPEERFIFNKLITGGLRIDISENCLTEAVSKVINISQAKIAIRLSGDWHPETTSYEELFVDVAWEKISSNPYSFTKYEDIGTTELTMKHPNLWHSEWHWEGIKSQVVKKINKIEIWSKNDVLITKKIPELNQLVDLTKEEFVLEGTLVVFKNGKVRPLPELKKRMKSTKVSPRLLLAYPVVFFASDILEYNGVQTSNLPLSERRQSLVRLLHEINQDSNDVILMSDSLNWTSWDDLNTLRKSARYINATGVVLKKNNAVRNHTNKNDTALIWKTEPYKIIVVLLYAQKGQAKQSNQYVEFTFAVKQKNDTLVPVTKTSNTLIGEEINEVTSYIKNNTIEKFGPVRSVEPALIFEISLVNVIGSKRHKSGIILQDSKIVSWKKELEISDIAHIDELKALIQR